MNELPRRCKGFTLIELIVTILVIAVLTAIALPSFRNVIQRNRVAAASNDLLASLAYARTTAINRGQLVSICPSADGTSCTKDGQAFEPGWIVYTYPAGAASANTAYAAPATLLRAIGARAGVSIYAQQKPVISFGLQGQLRPATTTLTFLTCSRTGSSLGESTASVPGVQLDVNSSGSVRTTPLAAGDPCGG